MKFKEGDKIKFRGKVGTLLTDLYYKTGKGGYGSQWGLNFAKIKWEDGTETELMMCYTKIEKLSEI